MGTAGLQARKGQRSAGGQSQPEPNTSRGLDNSNGNETVSGRMWRISKSKQERQAQEQAAAAAMSAAEKAAAQKTAELANSAGGGASIVTNGDGYSAYTKGNPGQDDSQSQGDVDLSTSDTTLRRRGGYRRDSGLRI